MAWIKAKLEQMAGRAALIKVEMQR